MSDLDLSQLKRSELEEMYRRSLLFRRPDWQAIETAPKDKPILVCRHEDGYRADFVMSPVTGINAHQRWEFYFDSEAVPAGFEPTHWMPLPAAPE